MLRSSMAAFVLVLFAGACASSPPSEEPRASESEVMAAGFRTADIRMPDGAVLKANVIEPATPGLHPAIVFPSSWGLFDGEYVVQAKKLATAGYTVLSYTPRGFWASGGEIDTAGPKDVADAHAVIDWLLAQTSADPAHVGMAGVSYGAGISLLASAFDDRIKAVGALSGWTDLVASLYADDTRRQQTVALLTLAAEAVGHPSAEFENMIRDFATAENIPALKTWGAARSAGTYLQALNQNRPAILIANAYGDSIFPPNQLVDFFGAYSGEKRLELRPGDHAIPEAKGLVGLPNDVWSGLRRWMDQHLRGGAPVENGIELHSQSDGPTEFFADWSSVSHATRRFELGGTRTIGLDLDTLANGGVALVSGALDRLTGIPPLVEVALVDRLHGAVWEGASGGVKIRGIPHLHFEITSSRASGTLVTYLYDVDALGIGRLITHGPASWRGVHADGTPRSLDVELPVTDYDVPADHHLAVVVDGKDLLYIDENAPGAEVTLRAGSRLELPVSSN